MKTKEQIIQALDESGAAVYLTGRAEPFVVCWAGIESGFLWFHMGDKPHWGPAIADLEPMGSDGLGRMEAGSLTFYICGIPEAPELKPGAAFDAVEEQRAFMEREQAISALGSVPRAPIASPAAGPPDDGSAP